MQSRFLCYKLICLNFVRGMGGVEKRTISSRSSSIAMKIINRFLLAAAGCGSCYS
jgi:hypothetical protein